MSENWYYGFGDERQGPFSGWELRALAEEGRIQPMDTIWKEGIDQGVPAHQVKNLLVPGEAAPGAAPDAPEGDEAAADAEGGEEVDAEQPAPPPKPPKAPPARKGRAIALRGAHIVGQDGEIVYFNRKCIKCGHQETGRSRLPIRNGVTRTQFFCPKCRKARPVEIQGTT